MHVRALARAARRARLLDAARLAACGETKNDDELVQQLVVVRVGQRQGRSERRRSRRA